jgi:hypothetical protein
LRSGLTANQPGGRRKGQFSNCPASDICHGRVPAPSVTILIIAIVIVTVIVIVITITMTIVPILEIQSFSV